MTVVIIVVVIIMFMAMTRRSMRRTTVIVVVILVVRSALTGAVAMFWGMFVMGAFTLLNILIRTRLLIRSQ